MRKRLIRSRLNVSLNIFAATITLGIAIYSIITGNNPHAAQQDGCSAKLISNFLVVSGIIDIMISLSLYLNPGLEIARWFNLSPNTERIIEKWEDFSVICNMNVFIRILFNFTSLVLVIAAASLLWSANCRSVNVSFYSAASTFLIISWSIWGSCTVLLMVAFTLMEFYLGQD